MFYKSKMEQIEHITESILLKQEEMTKICKELQKSLDEIRQHVVAEILYNNKMLTKRLVDACLPEPGNASEPVKKEEESADVKMKTNFQTLDEAFDDVKEDY